MCSGSIAFCMLAHAEVIETKVAIAASELPEPVSSWTAGMASGMPGLATLAVANLSTLGVVSGARLGWVADFLTTTLHANPTYSAGLVIQTNRSFDDTVKEEIKPDGSDSDPGSDSASEEGSARIGKHSSVRSQRLKVTEVLSEAKRKLNVNDITLIFDPETCWGHRRGAHDVLLVTARGHIHPGMGADWGGSGARASRSNLVGSI